MRLLLLFIFFACTNVFAEEFDARVIAVMDGDTVLVLRNAEKLKIRLANIDAPEFHQPFGKESRQALLDMVLGKQVHIVSQAIDSYGRMVAEIDLGGRNINAAQVSNGMAWEYSHFHRDKHYLLLQQQAQQSKKGLWGQADIPVVPEQWRKDHPQEIKETNVSSSNNSQTFCAKKHLCSQMRSCDEARLYYMRCGIKTLDGNDDGVPCESLCGTTVVKGVKVRGY